MQDFIKKLSNLDIHLLLDDGNIKVRHNGNLTDDIKAEIREHKANVIAYLQSKRTSATFQAIEKAPAMESYPLSSGQYRLWVIQNMNPNSGAYNMPAQLMLDDSFDIEIMEKAILATVERHEILRTVFKENAEDEIRQWILPVSEANLDIKTLDYTNEANKYQKTQDYFNTDKNKPFHLEKGPLFRIVFIRLSEKECFFYYNMHHIISDGWSSNIITENILGFYHTIKTGENVVADTLPIQYKDYAYWQKQQLQSEAYEAHRNYWKAQFAKELTLIDLPTNKVRPAFKTDNGHHLKINFTADIAQKITETFQKNGGSLFIGLMSAFQFLLHKYTGEKDIVIGSPIAGRDHKDLEQQIGFYVNTLAIRSEIETAQTYLEFFNTVKANILNAYKHQAYPFDELVQELDLKRDVSRNPLFDVSLAIENADITTVEHGRFSQEAGSVIDLGANKAKFDIICKAQKMGDALCLNIIFNSDVYEVPLMRQFATHFSTFLMEMESHLQTKIEDIQLISSEEKEQLLQTFNDTKVDYEANKTILDFFQENVAKTPNAKAITFENNSLTYAELDEKSNQLANVLLAKGISKGDFVPLCIERSLEMVVGIVAVLKTGSAYVPIGTDYPAQRINFILKEINAKLLLTTQKTASNLTSAVDVLAISLKNLSDASAEMPKMTISPADNAYVIYTSGTTGNPKGVVNGHAGLVNRLLWMKDDVAIDNTSVLLQKTPYTFDVSVWELLMGTIAGNELVIAKPNGHKDPFYLQEIIQEKAVTLVHFVPSMLAAFLESVSEVTFANLKHVVCSGEALSANIANDFKTKLPTVELHNYYGPTEAAIDVTAINLSNVAVTTNVSIGAPVANTQIYIVDEALQPQPIGVYGELLIGGVQVAKGYLNRSELTTQKFIPNPFKADETVYRTGDLACWNADGTLQFKGRIDDQVKIKGYRIELGEIEQVIQEIENIQKTVVKVHTTETGDELVAYIVADTEIDRKAIQNVLMQKLPDYMVPRLFMQIDEIPLNVNGKADKKKLPTPTEFATIEETYVAPTTAEEKAFTEVLRTVLKRDKVGIKDNFYNMGGDSIKSIQIVSKLKQSGFTIKVEEILRNPIVEDVAKLLRKEVRIIDQSAVSGEVILTPIQEKFFAEMRVPSHFNQSVMLKSEEAIHEGIVTKVMHDLVTHHDALRMRYHHENGKWTQYNEAIAANHVEITSHDVSETAHPLQEMGTIGDSLQSSINLENGPLCKVAIFKLKDSYRIAFIVHHLVIDGVSWRILLEDFITLYTAYHTNQTVVLPQKTDSFQYWAAQQQAYANSTKIQNEIKYWEKTCAQEIPAFYVEFEHEEKPTPVRKTASTQLDASVTDAVKTKIHNVYHTEVNDILITGLGLALKDVFGQEKCVIEMEGHGREDIVENIDVSRTIGWFTTMFPYVLEVPFDNAERQLVHVKDSLRNIPNKGIGYGMLHYLSNTKLPEIAPAILFNYLGDFGSSVGDTNTENNTNALFEYASEYAGNSIDANNNWKSHLEVSGMIASDQLNLSITYDASEYSAEKINSLLAAFERHITQLVAALVVEKQEYTTASDLTYKGLTYDTLQNLNVDNNVEDIYRLAPLQQGIYFTWLSQIAPEIYFEQTYYKLNGVRFDIDNLQKAYELLIQRHAILRTSFTSSHSEDPLQIVWKKVPIHFTHEALYDKGFTAEERKNYVDSVKKADRQKGFNLEEPSQMRLHVLDFGNEGYEFIWSHHHILMDGWCVSILINDFYQLLNDLTNHRETTLAPPVKYANYIEWLDGVDKQASLQHWKAYLANYEEKVHLPYTKQGFDINAYEELKEFTVIDGELHTQITKLCQELGITQNVFMQTVWGYVLSRYNHTSDAVFGLVVSGRPAAIPNIEEILGLFINTIPVRINYQAEETIAETLIKAHKAALESADHHYLNFSEVNAQCDLGAELIDHIMVFKDYLVQEQVTENDQNAFENSVVEDTQILERNNFQYNIEVIPSARGIRVDINYNTYRFDTAFIKNTLQHLKNIAAAFVANPTEKIADVDYISEEEKQQLHHNLSGVEIHTNDTTTVIDLFEQQAMTTPESVALQYEEKQHTYAELQKMSTAYAAFLQQEHQIDKGDVVGIYLNHSDWTLVAILGILKAGAVFVPIQASLPDDRKAFMVEDTNMKLLVTETNYMFELDFYDGNMTAIDVEFEASEFEGETITTTVTEEDLAYIIYTSGSTGLPKGVQVGHKSLRNYIQWSKQSYLTDDLANFDFGLFTSLAFDLTITSLFLPIVSGGKLNVFNDTDEISTTLQKYLTSGAACIKLTPAHISLMTTLIPTSLDTNIQMAIVGGDALQSTHVETLQQLNPAIRIYNEYGPTEATVGCIVKEIADANNITIGKPIANTDIYILDQNLQLVPKGIAGEICISGTALAKGYLNRADLSAEKFIENPFDKTAKLYKTGDLAVLAENNELIYLGRVDNQVKINGFRIELGEVEENIQAIETINSCIVIAQKTSENQLKLIAYFTASAEENIEQLKEVLRQKLPEYMIPSYFMQLETMPLTTNGKIDKKQLPNPANGAMLSQVDYVAPANDEEARMTNIIHQLIGIPADKISTIANFFDLGINSLELMKLQHMIRTEFQTEIHITTLFEHTTIKDLVAHTFHTQEEVEEVNISDAIDDTLDELF
ncbi:non-ribosomal peptide synthase protein (TIGR01720 family)/amino acid adenylation domain-containing protein [Kordia periserrulae]|uniref:Non-ribosomal peptide synthase protein (TIGR01720 family)/amino acid adenylation domain-containing protein n=1 Tax=Kordia periserrulae TaxID=701523 RepID=A0A2T6BZ72_9FLAO|nr:non-ribosomal peptide synthetase [Kordia periserrulae]PTX61370.1 non-ribosomal peptide synthase protein (TIGR01720 family)/amino acid adenylation domain-containing protein [Kordia periserrulae]